MTSRRVYSASSGEELVAAVDVARGAGLDENGISLIARSDIELHAIPDELKTVEKDIVPAAARGAGYGAAAGTLAGLAAAVFPPLGLTLAGAMLGGGIAGALVGTWASALVGASVPDPVRRKFEDEIEAGRVLVVIDADDEVQAEVAAGFARLGLTRLEYDEGVGASAG